MPPTAPYGGTPFDPTTNLNSPTQVAFNGFVAGQAEFEAMELGAPVLQEKGEIIEELAEAARQAEEMERDENGR